MENVLRYFREISAIPHGSGNRKPITDYLLAFAAEHALAAARDAAQNVIIQKPATAGYEAAPPVILQGHCDMVCEKDAAVEHDFTTDPLVLEQDGDWLYAKGTTLGGDDGIAVAYMLAILARNDLAHPALEAVFTTDEEIGMLGAAALNMRALAGRRMLNIDSEDEGIFLAGCAGGMTQRLELPAKWERVERNWHRIRLSGLAGGHSGTEIHRCRANAAVLSGRLLYELSSALDISLASCLSGSKDNAIPREAELIIGLAKEDAPALVQLLSELQENFRREYAGIETGITLNVEDLGISPRAALSASDLTRLLLLLMQLPNGVQKMSGEVDGLVETSCNLGILQVEESGISMTTSLRSQFESAKRALAEKIAFLAGFLNATVHADGEYPAWEYEEDSSWRDLALQVYRDTTGKEPKVEVIHAGLECGLFYNALPGLECISIGPDMRDIHTSRERLSLSSSARVYDYILALLSRAKE